MAESESGKCSCQDSCEDLMQFANRESSAPFEPNSSDSMLSITLVQGENTGCLCYPEPNCFQSI